MKIENELAQLTQSELGVLAGDRERWGRMGQGAHLDDWLAFGPGLVIRRRIAMRMANTNHPAGKGYILAFAALMQADGLNTMDKTSMTAVLWLHDEPVRLITLREIRDTMKVGERSRLNSPITARQRVAKVLKAREGKGGEETLRSSPMARMKEEVVILRRQVADLQAKLAVADKRDGSLFDIHHDTVDAIASVIVAKVTPGRAENIIKAIKTELKKKKAPGG
jgi:hypothetical protein